MNIKEYISSGIIESYVLGLASEAERREFEQLCTLHPELVEARTNFEMLVEKQAMQYAEAPRAGSKDNIWLAIQQSSDETGSKVIPMEPTSTRRSSALRLLAAASVILMLISSYFAYKFYQRNHALVRDNAQVQRRLEQLDSTISAKAEEERVMHEPNVTFVNLEPMKPAAPSATICWDTTSSDVYLLIKNMPRLATSQQYQLWSLIDSVGTKKATSLGLFDGGKERLFIRMNNAQKADAFAITIEKAGNTGGPDPTQMQLMGETKRKKL